MTMKKVIVAVGVIGAVAAGGAYFGLNRMMTVKMKQQIDKSIAEMTELGDIKDVTYDDFSVNIFSGEGIMTDVKAVGPQGEVKVDKVIISDYDFISEIPHSSSVKLKNVRIPFKTAGISEEERKDFADFGFKDEFIFSISANHKYDEDAKTFTVGLSADSDNLGEYKFGLDIGNLNLKPFEDAMKTAESPDQISPILLMGVVSGLELNSASLEFNDAGLMTMAAEQLREEEKFKDAEDAAEVREMAADFIKQQAAAMGKGNNKLVRRFIKFLKSGKGIKITAAPEQKSVIVLAGSLEQIAQAMDLKTLEKLLGLEIDVK